MELKEIVAPTMKELFIQEIERKILSGEWKKGDRLPTEREMEKKMKVSRTSINTGLLQLEQNGFVEIVPRKGVFVGDYMRNGQLNTLISIMNFYGGKLSHGTFESLMSYRQNLECECAYLAAANRTPEDIEILRDLDRKIFDAQDSSAIAQFRFQFHQAICCATGNVIYPLIWNSFKKLSITFMEAVYSKSNEDPTLLQKELIQAIEARASDEARNIMHSLLSAHIEVCRRKYYL